MDLFVMEILTKTMSESSTDSSEDESLFTPPKNKVMEVKNYVEKTVHNYSEITFQNHFRMTRRTIYYLVGEFEKSRFVHQNVAGCKKIADEKMMLLSIWDLANTESFRQIADRFGMSGSSAHRCLLRVINFYRNMFLPGDSAYPSLNWIVPPFRDNGYLSEQQKKFNFKHSSKRIVVEHAFGMLKSRFRRLHFENLNLETIAKCIMACCILHNICIMKMDETGIEEHTDEIIIEDVIGADHAIRIRVNEHRREQLFNMMLQNGDLV